MTEENTNVENVEEVTDVVDAKETTPKEETFTKAQMEEIITKRVAREKDAATKKIQEAEKLAKMNADEKQKYEFEQLQAKLDEFEKKDQYYSLSKEANKMFTEKSIPLNEDMDAVLKMTVSDDAEKTQEQTNAMINIFERVGKRLAEQMLTGKSPRMNTSGNAGITKTDFDKMGYKEKVELNQKNPDLYNQLTKGD